MCDYSDVTIRRSRRRHSLATALREYLDESGPPVIEKPFLPSEVRRVVAELTKSGEVAPPS